MLHYLNVLHSSVRSVYIRSIIRLPGIKLSDVTMKRAQWTKYATRCPPAPIILRLFTSGRDGTSTPSPPLARWRLLVASYFALLLSSFILFSLGRTSYPINRADDGVVSSAENQGCDKQTLYPRAALLLNYKILTYHWRRSFRGWWWIISRERMSDQEKRARANWTEI